MARNVIYTAIFGGYDELREPAVALPGWDFICFTDGSISRRPRSSVWQVREVERVFDDPARDNRKYKMLPHRYLGGYDVSVYIDGNVLVRGDVSELVEKHLSQSHMAVYDHAYAKHRDRDETPDAKDCLYQEADSLIAMYQEGRFKEKPGLIKKQIERYRKEGYPEHNGLVITTVLLRRHNESRVADAMEAWWKEYKKESRRDQLSLAYTLWRTGFGITSIPDNVRSNPYFLLMPHG